MELFFNVGIFLLFAALWIAFFMALAWSPGSIDSAWDWVTGQPWFAQLVVWFLFLPVTAGTWDLGNGLGPRGPAGAGHRAGRVQPLPVLPARPDRPQALAIASVPGAGGEGGIRTPDGFPRTAFPVRRHRPLGDLSGAASSRARGGLAERVGFEPTVLIAHRFSRAAP